LTQETPSLGIPDLPDPTNWITNIVCCIAGQALGNGILEPPVKMKSASRTVSAVAGKIYTYINLDIASKLEGFLTASVMLSVRTQPCFVFLRSA
jgi:hypothetical protein